MSKNAESTDNNEEGYTASSALVDLAEETARRLADAAFAIGSQERRPHLMPWGDHYLTQQQALQVLEGKMKAGPKNGADRLYRENEAIVSSDEESEDDQEIE